MTVQELIEQLQALGQPDLQVFTAKDAEGNGFHQLGCVQIEPMMEGDVLADEDVQEYIDQGDDVQHVVMLWP